MFELRFIKTLNSYQLFKDGVYQKTLSCSEVNYRLKKYGLGKNTVIASGQSEVVGSRLNIN